MSAKVKDGLFLGDIDAAQDAEFLQLNGIVHIINCVPRNVPNLFQQSLGLDYVACDLDEVLRRPFFDLKNRQFMGLVQLIDRALEKTESVLVHSLNGVNRSPSVMMGYLMVTYCWGVDKAYEFLLTKRADIKPHESYVEQLCLLEAQLQSRFGSRATEQQLYEWHPSLVDSVTDEIVLVHTYLNTPSSANKPVAKNEPLKVPGTRRLSWIDQIPQMKKLYPSLVIRPERPPNHSYSDMLPANGWVDVLAPSIPLSTAPGTGREHAGSLPRPIAAFMETTATPSQLALQNDPMDPDDDASAANRARVHSFSAPRRREIELDPALSPGSPSSDRDESDLMIDVMPVASKQAPVPRYQQQPIRNTMLASNRSTRQPPPAQQPPLQSSTSNTRSQAPRNSLSSATNVFTSAARFVSSFSGPTGGGGVLASTAVASSINKASSVKPSDSTKPLKPGNRSTTTKQTPERRSSSGSHSARGTYTNDLPQPQKKPAFTIRRSIIDTEPWAATAAVFPSSTAATRPRTAPPRLRKKDGDAPLAFSTTKGSGLSRVNLDVWTLPESGGNARRLSSVPDYTAPPTRTQKAAANKYTAAVAAAAAAASMTATATRSRPTRAQWK